MQSEHPYPPGQRRSIDVSLPGADHLIVTFDSRCATNPQYDSLEVEVEDGNKFMFSGQGHPGARSSRGESGNWPKGAVLFPGAKARFTFTTGSYSTRFWGWRCVVRGVCCENPTPRMQARALAYELQRTLVCLKGRCARALFLGPLADANERACATQLGTTLFRKGAVSGALVSCTVSFRANLSHHLTCSP